LTEKAGVVGLSGVRYIVHSEMPEFTQDAIESFYRERTSSNPMDAHVGYDQDDRIVAMITRGIGNPGTHQHWSSNVVNSPKKLSETE